MMKKTHIKVYLTEEEHRQLKLILQSDGKSMSAFLRQIIQEGLKKQIIEWDEYHPYPEDDPSVVWLIPRTKEVSGE